MDLELTQCGSSIFGLHLVYSVRDEIIPKSLAESRENRVGRGKMQTFPPALHAYEYKDIPGTLKSTGICLLVLLSARSFHFLGMIVALSAHSTRWFIPGEAPLLRGRRPHPIQYLH